MQEVQRLLTSAGEHYSPSDLPNVLKEFQYEQGLPVTGIPNPQTLVRLQKKVAEFISKRAPGRSPLHQPASNVKSTATNFISKTFGGPPSSPKTSFGDADFGVQTAQRMLNIFFQGHVIEEDGKMGPRTKEALLQFQQAQKLPLTGVIDNKTHDFLVQIATPLTTDPLAEAKRAASASTTRTGAMYVGAGDWKAETAALGKAAQNIISHAMSDRDPKTQASLSSTLSAAGFSKAAAAVSQKHGITASPSSSSTSDFGPGF